MHTRKRTLVAATLATLMAVGTAAAAADAYPSRPVRVVVNSSAGGWLDVATRIVAQAMSAKLGQPVVVDNRPGADGRIGINAVKTATPDGYTILAVASTIALMPALVSDPGYDIEKDFIGIGPMARAPFFMVTAPAAPYSNFKEFMATARADPTRVSYATPGAGSLAHLTSESFLRQAGLKVLGVPYKGAGAALPDVMAGRVDFVLAASGATVAAIRGGRLKALGITSAQRLPSVPDVAPLAEQGVPNFSVYQYLGLLAPAGVSDAVLNRLSGALRASLAEEAVMQRFRDDAAEAWSVSPREFTEFLKQDTRRFAKLVRDLGIPKDK